MTASAATHGAFPGAVCGAAGCLRVCVLQPPRTYQGAYQARRTWPCKITICAWLQQLLQPGRLSSKREMDKKCLDESHVPQNLLLACIRRPQLSVLKARCGVITFRCWSHCLSQLSQAVFCFFLPDCCAYKTPSSAQQSCCRDRVCGVLTFSCPAEVGDKLFSWFFTVCACLQQPAVSSAVLQLVCC